MRWDEALELAEEIAAGKYNWLFLSWNKKKGDRYYTPKQSLIGLADDYQIIDCQVNISNYYEYCGIPVEIDSVHMAKQISKMFDQLEEAL